MARREIVPAGQPDPAARREARREADRRQELWQGYGGRATENAGWEISVQTSRWNLVPVWLAGAILAAIVALVGWSTPSQVAYGELPREGAMFLAGFAGVVLLGIPLGVLYGQFPNLMRTFDLESVEIRPDGITINAGRRDEGFFSDDEILTVGIETIKNEPLEFSFGLAGVIGTKHMVLLRGLDQPTAQRLGNDFEKARRTLWQQFG